MAPQFIPAGRTSIVKRGNSEFQLQTEYAAVPQPRITTTIFSEGQVLHKIEKSINKAVETIEEMHQVEDIMKGQHLEVSKVIRDQGLPSEPDSTEGIPAPKTRSEMLTELEEVEQVFRITPDGKVADDRKITPIFKKFFKHIIKELPQMIAVFASLPDGSGNREEGIYELERGRILLVSTGVEYFMVLVKPSTDYKTIAEKIRKILDI
jgi:hypothetical protein